jgi:hypothetical protein
MLCTKLVSGIWLFIYEPQKILSWLFDDAISSVDERPIKE